ncbi:hypothetical protein CEXT_333641 [Caerostris extrusa]|uniref:Uncharacterized protein n=1 Tax=Caerostris extrusa TaxID=172846 RepID=A0AAV4NLC6_CAEEX|nr:hypothetical protein CEXT_333641 [Caerostris extrusa]
MEDQQLFLVRGFDFGLSLEMKLHFKRRVLTDRVCISHDDGGGDVHGGRLQTVSPEGLLPEAKPRPPIPPPPWWWIPDTI